MATVNQKEQNEVKSKDLKGMQRNGNITESIMNKYIEIIGGKNLKNGIVIHNVVHVAKGFEKYNRKKLELQEVTFIPFMITNELNGINHWILVEINLRNKKIITYNPENIIVRAKSEMVNVCTDIKKYDGNWTYEISTSTTTLERKTDSGVFVSAWIESIVQNGGITNCIKSSMVYIYREKMYKALMIKDIKDINNTRGAEKNLKEVIQYRNELLKEKE